MILLTLVVLPVFQAAFGTTTEPSSAGPKYWTFDRDITYLQAILSDRSVPGGLVEFTLSNYLGVNPNKTNVPVWAAATLKLQFDNGPCQPHTAGRVMHPSSGSIPQQCPTSSSAPAQEAIPLLVPQQPFLPALASISGAGDGG